MFTREHVGKNDAPITKCVLDIGSIARPEDLDLTTSPKMVQYVADLVATLRSKSFSIFLALPELPPRVKREMEAVGDMNQCKWIVSKGKETTILAADVAKQKGAILFSNKKLPSSKRVKQVTRDWYNAHREPFPGPIPIPSSESVDSRHSSLSIEVPPSAFPMSTRVRGKGAQFAPIASRYTSPSPSSSDSGRGTPKGRYKWRPCRHYLWNNHDHVGKQCGFLHPCLDFVEGRCFSGGNCENDHLCIDDLVGQCPVGDRCTLCHVDPSEKENLCNFILEHRPSARQVLIMHLQNSRAGETSPIVPPSIAKPTQIPPPPPLLTGGTSSSLSSSYSHMPWDLRSPGPVRDSGPRGYARAPGPSMAAVDRERAFSLEADSASVHSIDSSFPAEHEGNDNRFLFGGAGGILGSDAHGSSHHGPEIPNYGGVHSHFVREGYTSSPTNSFSSSASEASHWEEPRGPGPLSVHGLRGVGNPSYPLFASAESQQQPATVDSLLAPFHSMSVSREMDSESVGSTWSVSDVDNASSGHHTPFDSASNGLPISLGGLSVSSSAPGSVQGSGVPSATSASAIPTSLGMGLGAPPGFMHRAGDPKPGSAFGSIRSTYQGQPSSSGSPFHSSYGGLGGIPSHHPPSWGPSPGDGRSEPSQMFRISQLSRPNRIGRMPDHGPSRDWHPESDAKYLSSSMM